MSLKEWAKLHYKEPDKIKIEIKEKLEVVHNVIDTHGMNQENLDQEKDLYWKLYKISRKEDS